MEKFNLPQNPTTLIFDIDGTLYTSAEFVQEQIDVQVRHWADINGMSHEDARKKIADFRKKYAAENDGKKISLGNVFLNFGVDIDTSIRWRIELLKPENFLKPNEELKTALEKAAEKFTLIAVTNNPVEAARKTLAVLGLDKIIPEIIGLDTCRKSKPAKEILDIALERTGAKAEECISIGDRYDIDLSLPVKMGMGGVLVNGADEVIEFLETL
ncbi:HAD family hydrolase [Treponema sp.]|uniref:HAD family hydrolase n=1 Tax=Treponema sp. TaxID=166 RepID=UPI002A7FBD9D|nr:HAD family hydrolase [Treponema sp.]MCI6442281.1 HAD family hydrolase [Spirochaetia bacterium]MDY4133064.1 HAD family hydrolase [Treponema sp.]